MYETHVRPARDLRNNYPEISRLAHEHNKVIITNNGKGDTVLLSMETYQKVEQYINRQAIIDELKLADQELANPDAKYSSVDEVLKKLDAQRAARRGL